MQINQIGMGVAAIAAALHVNETLLQLDVAVIIWNDSFHS